MGAPGDSMVFPVEILEAVVDMSLIVGVVFAGGIV